MQIVFRILLPIIVLALGWGGAKFLGQEKEKQQRPRPPQRVIKTKVLELNRTDYQTVIRTQGVVRAHNESALTAEVSGKVINVSPNLRDGAFFTEGEILVELDDADFQTAVVAAEATAARMQGALDQEVARGKQAKLNWEDLGYEEEPNDLVLRLPQLREAKANVRAAEASLEQAKRDLARTKVRAPFSGRVLVKSVAIGQSVGPNSPLATAFDTTFVEVRLPISSTDLQYVTLPEAADETPVDVDLSDTLNLESGATWKGKIIGTEGALDESSRELFAIARVDDPFGLKRPPAERGVPLRVGQPVVAAIKGKIFSSVLAIPRSAVRQLNRIYLVKPTEEDESKLVLSPHEIEPVFEDADFHVIDDETVPDGSLLATTRLVYAPKESPVEILPDVPALETANPETPADATPKDT